jgi:hypothetical protein
MRLKTRRQAVAGGRAAGQQVYRLALGMKDD